jgi:microcystin-dependent protein
MADPFVGQIFLLPFNFAPKGFAFCQGQLLPLSQNTALFSLLGTTYGGDGKSTFALPDLRGRVPIGEDQGPGLANYPLGQSGGVEAVTLAATQIPQHTHAVNIASLTAASKSRTAAGNQQTPVGNIPAIDAAGGPASYTNAAPDSNMHASAVTLGGVPTAAISGGDQPHTNMQPSLTLNFCIALQGVFPPRS